MTDEARRLKALPVWGDAPLPPERDRDHRKDSYDFGSVFKLVVRAWPFINRYLAGVMVSRTLVGRPEAAQAPTRGGGFLYMPLLVTVLVAWFMFSGVASPDDAARAAGDAAGPAAEMAASKVETEKYGASAAAHGAEIQAAAKAAGEKAAQDAGAAAHRWLMIAHGLLAFMAGMAWVAIFTRRRIQAAVMTAGALAGLGAFLLVSTTLKGSMVGWGAAAIWAAFLSGWFLRFEVQESALIMRVRIDSHLIYWYVADALRRTLVLVTAAVSTDLLYQGILLGNPLSAGLASLVRRPDLAVGAATTLSAAQRSDLQVAYLVITVTSAVIGWSIWSALQYYTVWIQQQINQDLRLALIERWHKLSIRFHAEQRVGDSVYRIFQDSAQVTTVVGRLVIVFTGITALFGAVFVLLFFDPRLALIAGLIGVPAAAWAAWFSPRMRTRGLVAREATSALTSRIQELFAGVRIIKAFGKESQEQAKFEEDSIVAFNAAYKARSLAAITGIITFFITCAFLLPGQYFMAVWASETRPAAAAGLIGLIGLSYVVWNAGSFSWVQSRFFETAVDVRKISNEWAFAQDTAMGLHRVFDILDIEPEVTDAPDAKAMPAFTKEIRFQDVSFGYDPAAPILKEVSFCAKAGEITAIVGPTGSGKSTLMSMALRLFDPDQGAISIDGEDIRKLRISSLRDNISIGLQENILFGMSVADNIRYVVPDAPMAAVEAAARVACAHDFIAAMPEGYNTMLGDRGGRLSSGQRQRISIARALLKDAPILILDEPTAALDAATEHQVMQNLQAWGKGRAIFVITHRFSTIRRADQILFLRNGVLSEQGSHDDLMKVQGGSYRNMVSAEQAPSFLGAAE
jgi:ABC-type multidrug transport system fused ATPase/permease subunit